MLMFVLLRGILTMLRQALKDFTTQEIIEKLQANDKLFSSANSINWGRLLPQIVYYISAYCDLVNNETINFGDKVNVVVPTGNFGNILAAYYAMLMGLPIKKFICASNSNNVLTDFINTGVYDKSRQFYTTISPSMDILVSSNLERLLYILSDGDDKKVKSYMTALKTEGKYTVDSNIMDKLTEKFFGGFCNEESTQKTIKELYEQSNYLADTHTAVAVDVYAQYVEKQATKKHLLFLHLRQVLINFQRAFLVQLCHKTKFVTANLIWLTK